MPRDTTNYGDLARQWAGTGNDEVVQEIAQHLHYNESLHMHDDVGSDEPCSYCWLRAGKALQAIRRAGFTVSREPAPAGAS